MNEQGLTDVMSSMSEGVQSAPAASDTQGAGNDSSANVQQQQAPEQGVPVFEFNKEGSPAANAEQKPFDFEGEIKSRFNRSSTELADELASIETLKKKAEAKSYRTPFAEQFDLLTAPVEAGGKGIPDEVALQYLKDTSKMSPREFLALNMRVEHGSAFSNEEIQDYIDQKYSLGKYAGVKEGDDDAEIAEKEKPGLTRLKFDVAEARKKESELKANMLKPYESKGVIDAQEERAKAERSEAARKENWKPAAKKLVEDFKQFKVPFGSKKINDNGTDKTVPVGFFNFNVEKLPVEVKQKIADEVNNYVTVNRSIMPDEQGTAYVRDKIMKLAVLEHALPYLNDALIKFGNSQERDFWSKESHNPAFNDGSQVYETAAAGGDPYDNLIKMLPKN